MIVENIIIRFILIKQSLALLYRLIIVLIKNLIVVWYNAWIRDKVYIDNGRWFLILLAKKHNHWSGEYMVRAVGWAKISQFFDFTNKILSTELFTIPSYLILCSVSIAFIFIMAPSFIPTMTSDYFLPSVNIIDLG